MRFRDRLSDEERAFTEAYYYTRGPAPDLPKVLAAYEEVLRRDSTNATALRDLAVTYLMLRRYNDAAAALRRSMTTPNATGNNHLNLVWSLSSLRDTVAAGQAMKDFSAKLPDDSSLWWARASFDYGRMSFDSVAAGARATVRSPKGQGMLVAAHGVLADFAARRGRPREYLTQMSEQYASQFLARIPAPERCGRLPIPRRLRPSGMPTHRKHAYCSGARPLRQSCRPVRQRRAPGSASCTPRRSPKTRGRHASRIRVMCATWRRATCCEFADEAMASALVSDRLPALRRRHHAAASRHRAARIARR